MPRVNHYTVKLTEEQIAAMVAEYNKDHRNYGPTGLSALARKYGISRQRLKYYIDRANKKGGNNNG